MSYGESIILIGMPGSGKSTIGLLLAKELVKDFVDTDVLIQVQAGKSLQAILDSSDYLQLRQLEENVLVSSNHANHVIATGGSAVYSEKGMAHLTQLGVVVFLDVSAEELQRRIHNFDSRGIARKPQQSFADLFAERRVLYQKYAEITVPATGKTPAQIVEEIVFAVDGEYAMLDA